MFHLPIVLLLLTQSTGKITGKVTDALTHRPIQGVHVSGDSGSHFVGALTGVDGSYTLDDVPAGPVRMTVNLDGYRLIIELRENGSVDAGRGRDGDAEFRDASAGADLREAGGSGYG